MTMRTETKRSDGIDLRLNDYFRIARPVGMAMDAMPTLKPPIAAKDADPAPDAPRADVVTQLMEFVEGKLSDDDLDSVKSILQAEDLPDTPIAADHALLDANKHRRGKLFPNAYRLGR